MKRFRCALLAGALAAALTVPAYAADFTHCADSLKELGLFAGTNQGYELDRAATRAEAGVMLVRLLGKEAEAKQTAYTAPFTDVADWAKPYVGWLYRNQLTAGVSDTAYGPNATITPQQYATFLLRALGYADQNGDFAYADALAFAEQKGVVNALNCDTKNFLRDDVVAMSYTALSRPMKGTDENLLAALVQKQAVSQSTASNYLLRFQNYSGYEAACEAVRALDSRETETTTDLVVTQNGQTTGQAHLKTEASSVDGGSTFASVTRQNDAVIAAMYYDDGVLYQMQDGKTTSTRTQLEPADTDLREALPLCMFSRVQATGAVGGVATYTLTTVPDLADRIVTETAQKQGFASLTENGFSVDKLVYTVGTDIDGSLNRKQAEMGFTTQIGGKNAGVTLRMDTYLTATGDRVRVTVPDAIDR